MTIRGAVLLAVLSVVAACQSGTDGVTRADCGRLREHVADLTIAQGAATLSDAERAKQRANLSAAGGEDYIDHCVKERSEKYVDCALAAATLEEFGRCAEAK